MFEISVEHTIASGHALRGYKGKCEHLHGHNYKVLVTVAGEKLDDVGLLIDFLELRAAVQAVTEPFDHRMLNDLPPFDRLNPSAENMAKYFCVALETELQGRGVHVQAVTVWETESSAATYRPAPGTR
jgi:6-pyruvoyltetrahydropterin/6-carboxytetrahydropterin synthase